VACSLLTYVGYWGKTGKHLLAASFSQFGPEGDIGGRAAELSCPAGSRSGPVAETGVAGARDGFGATVDPELAENKGYVIANGFLAYL
jgi:hypothetical protein